MKPNLSPKRSEIAWTDPMAQSQDAEYSESAGDGGISAIYPLLPLRQTLVFPKLVAPMAVSREDSLAAIDVAMAEDQAQEKSELPTQRRLEQAFDDIVIAQHM